MRERSSMANKKICFIVTDAISFNVLFKYQLEYFRKHADLDVTLICGGNEEQLEILRKRLVGTVVNANFERKISLVKDIKSLVFLSRYLLSKDFDIIIYSTPKALLLGSIASAFDLRSRTIAVVHGRVYENFVGLKKLLFQSFDRLSFIASNRILFVSNSLFQNYIDEKLINPKAGKVIKNGSFNGVDINFFHPVDLEKKHDLRNRLSLPNDSFVICVVGRMCVDKGISDIGLLARDLAHLNLKIVFVGNFEDTEAEKVIDEIVKRNQGYYIPHTAKINEIFQCSDLHLLLSHREGFGNVAIEAASCGIPTFAYDVVGVKDSVSNTISGQRFDFQDYVSISDAITDAVNDSDFNLKYPFARQWAIDNFEQKAVWQNYLNFYLENI